MKTELKIDWCSYKAAKYAVENWHYSKRMPSSKLNRIGAWESDRFIGVVLFGLGSTRLLVNPYGLNPEQGCELVRVALRNHKTTVTKILSIAIKLLKKHNPDLRLIVSFADLCQNHSGVIYQAGNWIFAGNSKSATEYIYNGRRYQGRGFRSAHKNMEHHPSVTKVMGSSKYRYLYPLDRAMRKQIEPLRQPHPKRAGSIDSDAVGIQLIEGGAIPTPALQRTAERV